VVAPRQRRQAGTTTGNCSRLRSTCSSKKGFAATRAEEVARRAGVSKGTLYLYYPSKEELLKAVIAHYLSARIAATAQEVPALRRHHGAAAAPDAGAMWQQVYASQTSGTFKLIMSERCATFPTSRSSTFAKSSNPAEQLNRTHRATRRRQRRVPRRRFAYTVHSLLLPMVMLCTQQACLLGACTQHSIDAPAFIAAHVTWWCGPAARGAPRSRRHGAGATDATALRRAAAAHKIALKARIITTTAWTSNKPAST